MFSVFISSGIRGIGADFAQAYSDTELYQNAIEKVKSDQKVKELLGEIEPIDKFAILEGRLTTQMETKMDISADRIENRRVFKKVNVQIKDSNDSKQRIKIIRDSKK